MRKGNANPLGLDNGTREPLVIVSFTVNWAESRDDDFVKTTTRRAVEQIDAVAAINKMGHPYRYLNYCAEWQKPFEGYGAENWRFLQGVSRRYDPEGLFQKGCIGGFISSMWRTLRLETWPLAAKACDTYGSDLRVPTTNMILAKRSW